MKKIWPYIAGSVLFICVVLLVIFHKPQRHFDNRISLNPTQRTAYGTYAAYQSLSAHFPKANIVINKEAPGEWKFKTKDSAGHVLFVLVDFFNPTAEDLNLLTIFAQKGNYVFISALQMNERAQNFFRLKEGEGYDHYEENIKQIGISEKDSFIVVLDKNEFSEPTYFSYPGISFDNSFYKYDSSFSYELGHCENGLANLLALRTIKGAFFLHTAPITFSNLFLLYKDNHIYFDGLMSLLPQNAKTFMWDEYFQYHKTNDNGDRNNILHVLLSYENFRWAFWLAIVGLVLYLVTEIKRRQRLSPQITPPANETLSFVSTIGKLYYEKGDHKNLADKLSVYFFEHIRSKYKLQTTDIDDDFNEKLALKTGVPVEKIREITEDYLKIKNSRSITQQQLVDYYKKLEHFYSIT